MKIRCGLKNLCSKVEPDVIAKFALSSQFSLAGGVVNCPVFGVGLICPSHALLSDSGVDRFIGYPTETFSFLIFVSIHCLVLQVKCSVLGVLDVKQ